MKNKVFIGILVFVGMISYLTGILSPVKIEEKNSGEFYFLHKKMTGAYKNSKVGMDEIFNWTTEKGIKTTRGVGLYYDNPSTVAEADLRCNVGVIIEESDLTKLRALTDNPYHFDSWYDVPSVVVERKFKNPLMLITNIIKVYPKIGKYFAENYPSQSENSEGGAAVEIYDMANKKHTFIMPIGKPMNFVNFFYYRSN
jgi:hypothetical protein